MQITDKRVDVLPSAFMLGSVRELGLRPPDLQLQDVEAILHWMAAKAGSFGEPC